MEDELEDVKEPQKTRWATGGCRYVSVMLRKKADIQAGKVIHSWLKAWQNLAQESHIMESKENN